MSRLSFLPIIFCLQLSISLCAQYAYKVDFEGSRRIDMALPEYGLYIYNYDSLLIERRKTTNVNTAVYDGTRYEYNSKKQKITETEFNNTDKILFKKDFIYDDSGKLKTVTYIHRDKMYDSIEVKESYTYNDTGLLKLKTEISVKIISGNSYPFASVTTTYNYEHSPGQTIVTEYSWYGKGSTQRKKTVYNDKGLVISESDKEGKREFSYQYDDTGLWVKKKCCNRPKGSGIWNCPGELIRSRISWPH